MSWPLSEGRYFGPDSLWPSWPSLVLLIKWWPKAPSLALRPLRPGCMPSGTYVHICLMGRPVCEGMELSQCWQGASLCYLSSICFADVCRLDFLWATCVVTLSRSILWFCRTSSRCLHLEDKAEKHLRRAESYILSMPANQESLPCVSTRMMKAGIMSRESEKYCKLLAL